MRENLKQARKAAGLTQQQLADRLGISLRYYQQIEAGDRTGDFVIRRAIMEWWEGKFNKEPDLNYIIGVLLDIYAQQNGLEVTHYEVVARPEKAPVDVSKEEAI